VLAAVAARPRQVEILSTGVPDVDDAVDELVDADH